MDVSTGLSQAGQGLVDLSTGYQKYLKSAESNASNHTALQIADEAQLELQTEFQRIKQEHADPQIAALEKTKAYQRIRDKAYTRADSKGVGKDFSSVATKFFFNQQADILQEAQQMEGIYAQAQLTDGVEDYKTHIQQQVQESLVEQDLQSGKLTMILGIDGFRKLSERSEILKKNIQRALQSMPPEKILETISTLNKGLEDSYAKALIGSVPNGTITSSVLDHEMVVPEFRLVDGQVVSVPRTLTQEEKLDILQRGQAHLTMVQSQLEHEKNIVETNKERMYETTRGEMERQYGELGKDASVQQFRAFVESRKGELNPKRYADLQGQINTLDTAIKTAQKSFTDEGAFMDLLFRIQSKEEVPYGEILQQSINGNLNREDFHFLLSQKSQFDGQVKTEFDKQFNATVDSIEGLFIAADQRSILGDKISEYKFFIRQKALELKANMTQDELADASNANALVLRAASDVIPGVIANAKDSSSGIDKSRFGRFFQVLAGGDLPSARHMLATMKGMSVTQRANLKMGIAGMEAIEGIQAQVGSGAKTSFGIIQKPHEQIPVPNNPVGPLVPDIKTVLPGAQPEVNRIESQRQHLEQSLQKTLDERAKRLERIRQTEEKPNGSQ